MCGAPNQIVFEMTILVANLPLKDCPDPAAALLRPVELAVAKLLCNCSGLLVQPHQIDCHQVPWELLKEGLSKNILVEKWTGVFAV